MASTRDRMNVCLPYTHAFTLQQIIMCAFLDPFARLPVYDIVFNFSPSPCPIRCAELSEYLPWLCNVYTAD